MDLPPSIVSDAKTLLPMGSFCYTKGMAEFVHLHNRSDYSLLDGAAPIKELAATAKRYVMPGLAITDHGNLFGALSFYKACKDEGISDNRQRILHGRGSRRKRPAGERQQYCTSSFGGKPRKDIESDEALVVSYTEAFTTSRE